MMAQPVLLRVKIGVPKVFAPRPGEAKADQILEGVIDGNLGIDSDRDRATLYQRVKSEKRDPACSSQTERSLSASLRDVPYLTAPARVMCGSTVCEVAGAIDGSASIANANIP